MKLKILSLFVAFVFSINFPAKTMAGEKGVYENFGATDIYIFSAGAALGAPGYFLGKNVKAPTESEIINLNINDINSFDRSATNNYNLKSADASDVLLAICVAAPALLALDMDDKQDVVNHGIMMIENLWLTGCAMEFSKGASKRLRPYVYEDKVPVGVKLTPDSRKSFFSGHTSTAFASMTFLATTYQDYYPNSVYTPYVWVGGAILASTVGYLRYDAGKHFPTDIIAGALVGITAGYVAPELHKKASKKTNLGLALNAGGYRFSFSYKF